ncbi:hypothetical protein J4727_04620 [Providencia rettgeri]|uniref:Uncharacterized protein n=1 Tax=Providencia rettgeri TaxID=587 RepID=A0A939NGN7_PRORE|nr:hypothetical protein [Providencia rettgeri]
MFATFGTLLLTFVVLTILNISGLASLLYCGALLCSIFISMMIMIPLLLLFSIENSIKLQLVWVVIVASCLISFLSNRHYLDIYFNSIERKRIKSQKQNKKRKNSTGSIYIKLALLLIFSHNGNVKMSLATL